MILPVKRLAVTAFIALYTLVLMWSTVDRTYTWAAKQSLALSTGLSSSGTEDATTIGRLRPASPLRQAHRRILQNPFVVEPPVLAAWFAQSRETLSMIPDLVIAGPDTRHLSGRAPPRFV